MVLRQFGNLHIVAAALLALLIVTTASPTLASSAHAPVTNPWTAKYGDLVIPPLRANVPIKLYTLDCGRVEMRDMDFLSDDHSMAGVSGSSVVPCYVIRHPKGNLMWDTGLPNSMENQHSNPADSFKFSLHSSLNKSLAKIGMSPKSFQYVSFSHMHFDHAGNGNLFADSTWIVDRRELDIAFSQQALERGESKHYDRLRKSRKIIIGDRIPHDVFSDGSVLIYRAAGHTAGHSILLLRMSQRKGLLLTGDLWITKLSQDRKLVPIYNASKSETLSSMSFAETLASSAGARIIRAHVIEDFDSLPTFPDVFE